MTNKTTLDCVGTPNGGKSDSITYDHDKRDYTVTDNTKAAALLQVENRELKKRIGELEEALEWFANLENYMAELKPKGFDFKHTPVHNEGYNKANALLDKKGG